MSRLLGGLGLSVMLLPLLNCGGSQHSPEEKYYLVAANVKLPYWQQVSAGLTRAAAQLEVRAEVVGPDTYDVKAQHERFMDVLKLKLKPAGIMVSASDPTLQKADIDAAIAQGIPVITLDSDAPDSKRLTFIGTDNYKAGVMGGQFAAKQLKFRGAVVVYTMPEQNNLKERLHGYTDVFAAYPQIKVAEVVDAKGDPRIVFDKTMEMLEKGTRVDAFVCLVSFACPEVAEVLARKKATDKVVVAMDTDEPTLEGIQKGIISATIAQKPYTMAFFGLKVLDDLHHHPPSSLTINWAADSFSPLPTFVDTGATLISADNVDRFISGRNSSARK
jgi:ribose transport system substrate-binding protein